MGSEVKTTGRCQYTDGGTGGSRSKGCIPVQPYKALGGDVLLLLELIENEVLEGF